MISLKETKGLKAGNDTGLFPRASLRRLQAEGRKTEEQRMPTVMKKPYKMSQLRKQFKQSQKRKFYKEVLLCDESMVVFRKMNKSKLRVI